MLHSTSSLKQGNNSRSWNWKEESPKKLRKHLLKYFLACNVAPRRRSLDSMSINQPSSPSVFPSELHTSLQDSVFLCKPRVLERDFKVAMKRWGFKGMPASHGCSLSHRAIGATGSREDPSGVMKGKKMAGRMGGKNATMTCLKVIQMHTFLNYLLYRSSKWIMQLIVYLLEDPFQVRIMESFAFGIQRTRSPSNVSLPSSSKSNGDNEHHPAISNIRF